MSKILFKNAQVITATGVYKGEVLVEDDKIAEVAVDYTIDSNVDKIIDVEGQFLSPGFIDVHTHGAGGYDFMQGIDAIYEASRVHLNHGTTTILPTTITGSKEELFDYIKLFNEVKEAREGYPRIYGLHLEGPYFAATQAGAQNPKYLRNPSAEEYEKVFQLTDRIKRWSFAIELEGSQRFLKRLRDKNIVASLAHSEATCDDVYRGFETGLKCLTHFYSCMATVKRVNAYRVAGAIEAGYLLDDLFVEVIADGSHLPEHLLKLIYKVKGSDKVCLVTDSVLAAGMPDGKYVLGGVDIIKEDNVAKLADRTAFAGSVATMDLLVRTFRNLTNIPIYEVVKMASLTPAKLLGIDKEVGSIATGKVADLLIFDETISIKNIICRGKIIR